MFLKKSQETFLDADLKVEVKKCRDFLLKNVMISSFYQKNLLQNTENSLTGNFTSRSGKKSELFCRFLV